MVQLCFADYSRADAEVMEAGVSLLTYRDTLSQSEAGVPPGGQVLLAVLRHGRTYSALIHRISAPVLLIHGEQDRLVPIDAARRVADAKPDWQTEWLTGVGHTPQLEVPDRFVAVVERWLAARPA